MKHLNSFQQFGIGCVAVTGILSMTGAVAQAAYPSRAIVDLTIERYSLLLESDRSSCAYYANPDTLQILSDRSLSVVKMINRESPGTACNGVFDFQVVRVKCATNEVAYGNSVVGEVREWQQNVAVAEKVCGVRMPYDREVFTMASEQYSLLVDRGRDSCAQYVDPSSLSIDGSKNQRRVGLLIRGDEESGTACRGVFEFKDLTVRCDTDEVSVADHHGSPASWVEDWQKDDAIAQQICALPAVAR
jgi:hypothetical protein